jgi:hypothetical protein
MPSLSCVTDSNKVGRILMVGYRPCLFNVHLDITPRLSSVLEEAIGCNGQDHV